MKIPESEILAFGEPNANRGTSSEILENQESSLHVSFFRLVHVAAEECH